MAKNKINRIPLIVELDADVHHVSPSKKLVINISDGNDIEIHELKMLENSEFIVRELNLYLRGLSAGSVRSKANTILLYLRYVVSLHGEVGIQTLKDYKKMLDKRDGITLSTKRQIFNGAISFVRHLMSAGILAHADLPRGFPVGVQKHKENFIDAVRYQLPVVTKDMGDEIDSVMTELNIKEHEGQALIYGRRCMRALREYSEKVVRSIISDWNYVNEVITSLKLTDLDQLRELDFRSVNNKTIEIAMSILYANFGRALPPTALWPVGINDWCRKNGGWLSSRIEGAFFLNIKTLDSFLVLILSDGRIMPNVDSVAFYTYIDCCKPSSESGCFDVFLDKKRGSATTVTIRKNDITVVALLALTKQVKMSLPYFPEGKELLSQQDVSIFLSCQYDDGVFNVKTVDATTPAAMVRRFMKKAAKEYAVLGPLVISGVTGENFRLTHAYLKKISGKSIYEIKEELGHSSLNTTDGYVKGIETQTMLNKRHQDFQRFIIDEAKLENNINENKRTGSGYYCGDQNTNCIEYLKCTECEAKRVVFTDVNIVAEWLAWEAQILADKNRLEIENNERWCRYWEPKLVEYQTLITLSKESILNKARSIYKKIELPWLS